MVKKATIVAGAVVVILLVLFGLSRLLSDRGPSILRGEDMSLLNPVLVSSLQKHFIINFQPLRETFLAIQKRYAPRTHVYFVYLNNAAWIGLEERELLTAASMVKVPLAMAVYKAAEEGKIDLDAKYSLEEVNIDPNFGELHELGEGGTLTVERLVEIMLTQSDNTAANALYTIFERIGVSDPLAEVYRFMGWETENFNEEGNYGLIHLKILSNMFLALYNGIYINPEHSQQVLQHLTETSFNEEIVAGVPKNVPVAHKIGIYDLGETYSDCGIVYAPNREYILCAAAEGLSRDEASRFIAEISKAAYDYVITN